MSSRLLKIIGGYHAGREVEVIYGCDYIEMEEFIPPTSLCRTDDREHRIIANRHRYRVATLYGDGKEFEILIPTGMNHFDMLIELVRGYKPCVTSF